MKRMLTFTLGDGPIPDWLDVVEAGFSVPNYEKLGLTDGESAKITLKDNTYTVITITDHGRIPPCSP